MTLRNLLRTGQLKEHPVNAAEIRRLLDAARRNLGDARAHTISPETRFDVAYKAIMQAALAALMANGFLPDTKRPGHHMMVLQSLPISIGLASERMLVLDTFRRKRNLSDYMGEDIDDASAEICAQEAERLLGEVAEWMATIHPEFNS